MSKDKNSNYSTSWGLILSVLLHGIIMILIVVWGVRKYTDTDYTRSIEVNLSDIKTGSYGAGYKSEKPGGKKVSSKTQEKDGKNAEERHVRNVAEKQEPEKQEGKKPEVKEKNEPEKTLFRQELKVAEQKEPEKKIEKQEPVPVKKAEKEPSVKEKKTEKIPMETVQKKKPEKLPEKKVEKKQVKKQPEPEKTPEKQEVVKKIQKKTEPESTENKATQKQTEEITKTGKDNADERKNVLNEIKRKNVISSLRPATISGEASSETVNSKNEENVSGGAGGSGSGSDSGERSSKVNPTILKLFQQSISKKIKEKFKIPPNIPKDGSLRTELSFKIDKYGHVSSVKIEKSSGNPSFDKYCVNAVYSSSPFPSPPGELVELSQSEGFIIDMNNEG